MTKHKSGDLLGVFHRDGFGDIDLVWGDNGGGLAHIIQRHVEEQNDFNSVEEVRDVIDDVIKNGKIVRENADKVNIDYNGYRVSVRKNVRDGQGNIVENKNWVVTAFDRNTPKHEKRRTSSSETLSTPSANQEADGVTLPSNDNSSESKDTTKVAEGQGKSEESKETSLSEQISTASAEVNTNPTEAQKEAGNFKKGHVQVGTFDITIEQPQGSIRRGKDANGKKWESKMHNTYGYFRGTEGVDGDHIDVFLSNDIDGWNGRKVFVVDQYNPDGTFDEHKVMLGFNDIDEAKSDYLANYENGWENGRRIDVTPVSLEDFEKWIGSSHRKTKAFAEYAGVKKEDLSASANGEGKEKVKPQEELKPKKPKNEKGEESKANGENGKGEKIDEEPDAEEKAYLDWKAKDERDLRKKAREYIGSYYDYGGATPPEVCAARALSGIKITPESFRAHTGYSKSEQAKLVGLIAKKENGGVSIDRACELAALEFYEENGYEIDFYEMRDIVLDVLREGNPRGYEKRYLEEEIKKVVDHYKYERDMSYEAEYGMDYDTYMRDPERRKEVLSSAAKSKSQDTDGDRRISVPEDDPLGGGVPDGNVPFHRAGESNGELTKAEVALRDAVVGVLRKSGIDVVSDVSEGQRVLDMANGKERLSGKQKRALETATWQQQDVEANQATVVSSADGAKVLNNLDNLAKKLLEKESNRSKTFIGDVARAIGAKEKGSSSQYATFETKNGTVVTIRLANHNAKVSNFDNAGKDNAISIVITNKNNEGVTNDGKAHIIEFYYNKGKLNNADGKPLSEIVRSIKQALYSGEFKDTTGIAERQEVNGDVVREHRVYHGSGADFDSFDHSHMGEGEGAQAYGWGTYVTEVEGIGRSYAKSSNQDITYKIRNNGYWHDITKHNPEYETVREAFGLIQDRGLRDARRFATKWAKQAEKAEMRKKWVAVSDVLNNHTKADIKSITENHLYSVEIPEDNGKNYLDWNERLSDSQIEAIRAYLSENYRRNKLEDFDASIAEVKDAPNADEVNAWARRGENVYKMLSHLLGSDEAASKALSEMGFVGIKYSAENRSGGRKDGAKNYVVFNEGDAEIVDKVRFFKTQGGEAYGFTVGGRIYIDPRIASSETAVHEYAHLWAEALRSANAKEWGNVVGLMRGTSVWSEVMERYPELKSDDEIADEVLATYSGRRGSERLREEMDRIKGSERSVADKARALGSLERVKRALDRFWHGVADFLGIHYGSADEVADRVMRDLLSGVDPRRFVKGESIKENITKNERTLAGVHNITEEKLRKALKLGGLANPSVAVIDTEKQGHSGFGEISLIAPSSLVNKRTGRNAGTFFGDAWTPTYPQVERIFGKGGSDRAIADIASVPEEMQRMTRNAIDSFMDGKNADNLVYLYLQEKGIAPQLFKTKGVFSSDIQKKVISLTNGQPFYKLNETGRNKVVELYIEYKFDGNRDAFEKALQERVAKLTELQNEYKNPKSLLAIRVKEHLENIDNYGYDYEAIGRFVDDVNRDAKVSGKVSDIETMQEARNIVEKENLQKDFEQWKESLADRYNTKEVIFNGFTPSGNRRYVDNTLENVSKIMKRKGRNGAEGFGFSFNNFAANIMQSSGTLKGIKERKAQLTQQHEDVDAFIDKWAEVYNHLADALNPNADISTMDVGYYRLQETAVQKEPKEFAKKEYGVELSDEDVQQLNDMVKAIREERPTMYFETKFERPVMFNEFKAAVVPNNVSDEVRKALEQSGLTIFTYDPNVKSDRQRATNEAMQSSEDIRFQKVGDVNEQFNKELDEFKNGTHKGLLHLGKPRGILKQCGITAQEMTISPSVLHKHLKKHNLTTDDLKGLAESIQRPILVYKHGLNNPNMVVVTELNVNGGKLSASFVLDESGKVVEVSNISSVHSKDAAKELERLYKMGEIDFKKSLKWVEKEKVLDWLAPSSYENSGMQDNQAPFDIAKIINGFENPKVSEENQIESDKIDREYLQAVKEGDMEKAQRMVNEAAKRAGYSEGSDYQGTSAFNGSAPYGNGWYLTKEERKEAWENDEWDGDSSLGDYIDNGVDGGNIEELTNGYSYRAADPMRKEAIENVREVVENKKNTITMYRSVPSSVKEGHFRNGDWVTPSKEYAVDNARIHGWGNDYRIIEQEVPVDDVWFDGNDIAEWGYGRAEDVANEKDFGYKNTKNNRKLLDPVTYDDSGNVIPLSERFNESSGDVRFRDEVDGVVSSSGVDGMRERAVELGRELGADVDVVSDVSEITDSNPEVQERKRRAKGWYDAKTGRVVINLAAHSDMADVEQTLLHEIVGHRGLRGLVGHENFNGFLDRVYEHASDVVREGIDDIARRKGCSKRVATEEYMSGLAEGGFADRKNAGLWQQIRQWFGDMLSRAKIKLNFSISDNELRYLLWRSHELSRMNGREGVVGRARDLAMQNRLGVGNGVGKTALQTANERFNSELTRYQNGEMAKNEMLHLGRPQGVMRTFLPDLPIVMRQRILTKGSVRKHNVAIEALADMPSHLSHPIFVFERSDNALGVLTEMQDRDGKNVCVAIELSRKIQNGGEILEVNDVRSVHGRNVADIVYPIVQNGTLKWVDKEKGLTYLSSASQYVQQETDKQDLDNATKVVENFENPKVSDGKRAVDSYDGDLETLFRDADSHVDYERALIRDSYERRMKDAWFQSREALQDGMLSLKETMKDIWRSAGKKFSQITDIPDYANPYLGQNRLSSRNAAEVRDFKRRLFSPLLREVGRLTGFSADGRAKLTDYMMAKHGLERNKVMAERDAKHPNSLTCGP